MRVTPRDTPILVIQQTFFFSAVIIEMAFFACVRPKKKKPFLNFRNTPSLRQTQILICKKFEPIKMVTNKSSYLYAFNEE